MKFHELEVDHEFSIGNIKYKKVKEKRKNCCKVQHNALRLEDNKYVFLEPKQEVTVNE